jgi:hypothetical protein
MLQFYPSFYPSLVKGPPDLLGFAAHPPYMRAMSTVMKSILFALMGLVATPVMAKEPFAAVSASDIVLADLFYQKRIVAVFADDPNDPSYIRQMELLAANTNDLVERDVILVTDTNPDTASELRLKLRPSGFSLVIMDKDGSNTLRKPRPWSTREITRSIDKFPSRRIEMLERAPAGR